MALLTPLSAADARDVLASYGITIGEWRPLAAGSVNSNFILSDTNGNGYFARIYEEQGPAGARFELELNRVLRAAGVPVAVPVRRLDGGFVSFAAGKPFGLYERVAGESLCQKLVTPEVTRELGAALAEVHSADLGNLTVPSGRFDRSALLSRLGKIANAGRVELASTSRWIGDRLPELDARRDPALPRGLIHGDLFRDNVLVNGSRVAALLDFESACEGPYVYDVAVTILAWCYGDSLDEGLALALLEGYDSRRSLSTAELAALTTEGAMACLRFATTRMTDFSLRTPEGKPPARDYRRFLDRLAALESGAFDRVARRLRAALA